jgi:ribonuclease P/MRP protein subunit RPP40
MANIMNKYFISVLTRENLNNIPPTRIDSQIHNNVHIEDIKLTRQSIINQIDKLHLHKAAGPDEVIPRVLKEVKENIVDSIYKIFSFSLSTGSVPDDWRRANVVPIHKKGDKSNYENYRPISLTSVIGKFLESIIAEQITKYLDDNKLIRETQHGFRRHRSCLTNLLEFFHSMLLEYDKNRAVDIIYLDFKKAFDKVPHGRLMRKVRDIGITGKLACWIEDWLSNREQRVVINGEASSWEKIVSGVPQGSVLGPLLFIIYINDIDDGLNSKVGKFADDTKLGGGVHQIQGTTTIQGDLDRIVEWAEKWQMTFNVEKCKVMHMGNKNNKVEYRIGNDKLLIVETEKDLGVWIKNDLKSTNQCIEVEKKCNRLLGYIKRQFEYKTKTIVTTLYKSLVRPHLEYAVQFWSPSLGKDIDRLERVQARATKLIPEIRNLTYEERLKKLGMITLKARRSKLDLIQTFKIVKGIDNVDIKNYFSLNNNPTRNNGYKLKAINYKTGILGNFFTYRVVNLWNRLPAEVVEAETLGVFRERLDKVFHDL